MKNLIVKGLILAGILAAFVSPFASPNPDGLEKVAEDKGFLDKAVERSPIKSPIPDYAIPGVKSEKVATGAAGAVGTAIVFAAGYGLAFFLKRKDAGAGR